MTQALLDARALATGRIMAEVVCEEYGLPVVAEPVPIFGQSGDDRYDNVDKMILKRVDVLPHGLINNVKTKLGHDGGCSTNIIRWLVDRIRKVRTDRRLPAGAAHRRLRHHRPDLRPRARPASPTTWPSLEAVAGRFPLYIEGPSTPARSPRQIELLAAIRSELRARAPR